MNYRNTLLAAGAAVAMAGLANAQADYSHNWQTMNFGFNGALLFSGGDGLWGGLNPDGGQNFGGLGDTIRICYGVDATQGGTNEDGLSATSWFRLVQGHTAGTTQNQAGLVSATASNYDAAAGDACWSPLFTQADPTTGTALNRFDSNAFIFANLTYGGATAAPTFWFSYFQVFGATGDALEAANIGQTDPNSASFPGLNPLLTHMVMEIQGPANESVTNIQYYLATSDEVVGDDGRGGVTNCNLNMGEAIFGLGYTADQTGASVHSRLTSASATAGTIVGFNTLGFGGPNTDQWFGALAFDEPALWAGNDPTGTGTLNTGAGGMDWAISQTVSTIQLRVIDMLSGGEVAGTTIDVATGPASSITKLGVAASLPFFLFSGSEAAGTYQKPCGWCDFGGALPMVVGDLIAGPQGTNREGNQTLPVCFDSLTQSFLSQGAFSVGGNFRGAYDPNADAALAAVIAPSGLGWNIDSLFEDGIGLGIAGSASMTSPLPIGAAANPSLGGQKLCITAALIDASIDLGTGVLTVGINEFSTVSSVNLQ